jgi:hypothetical protein
MNFAENMKMVGSAKQMKFTTEFGHQGQARSLAPAHATVPQAVACENKHNVIR